MNKRKTMKKIAKIFSYVFTINLINAKIFLMVIFMEKIIFHIDVNNAFLSWTAIELLNNGYNYDIRNSYAVIGGDPKARR